MPGDGRIGRVPVHLHAAHSNCSASGKNFHLVFATNRARNESSGHDRSKSLHSEYAVDREPSQGTRIAGLHVRGRGGHRPLEIVEACACQRTHGDYGRVRRLQKCAAQKLLDFQPHYIKRLRIDRIRFGEHGDAALHAEQTKNVEVLAGLGLDGFVGRNHQQDEIDASDACQHVAHEALVAGDVDKAEVQRFAGRAQQVHVGEAQIDGDAAALFFLEPVRVNPGEGLHQRRLAVVDVAGRANDDRFHLGTSS